MNILHLKYFLFISLMLWIGLAEEQSDSANLNATSRDADLEQLSWWVSMDNSFTDSLRWVAQSIIASHRENSTKFTDAQFYMEVRRIVSLSDNGHTNVSGSPITDDFGLVPLRTYWFSDGHYVVRADKKYRHLLGTRIDAINGKAISELEEILMDYHGGTKLSFRTYSSVLMLLSPVLLHAVELSDNPDMLILDVTDMNGKSNNVEVEVDLASSAVYARPWRYLNPAELEHENGWATVHTSKTELPLFLIEEDKLFRYELIHDGQVAYIQLRLNMTSENSNIDEFTEEVLIRLEEDNPHSIIFDNRQNPGGDLTRTADFALALPSLCSPQGRVYVLTDPCTFSAGIYSSFYPKAADPDRTIIVGQHVGDETVFWAESGPPFVLRESGYRIGYSLQLHDLANGCHIPETCLMAKLKDGWNIAVGTFDPDWPIEYTFADYNSGRDPVIEYVMTVIIK